MMDVAVAIIDIFHDFDKILNEIQSKKKLIIDRFRRQNSNDITDEFLFSFQVQRENNEENLMK